MDISLNRTRTRLGKVVHLSAAYMLLKNEIDRLVSQWDKCINIMEIIEVINFQ